MLEPHIQKIIIIMQMCLSISATNLVKIMFCGEINVTRNGGVCNHMDHID